MFSRKWKIHQFGYDRKCQPLVELIIIFLISNAKQRHLIVRASCKEVTKVISKIFPLEQSISETDVEFLSPIDGQRNAQ